MRPFAQGCRAGAAYGTARSRKCCTRALSWSLAPTQNDSNTIMSSSALGSASLPDSALHSAPTITSDVLVRLERDGTARYGSAALAVDNAKAEGETMLLYFHAFAFGGSGNLDALHTRLMNLPLMQAVPLVRDAAMLIFCNNPAGHR